MKKIGTPLRLLTYFGLILLSAWLAAASRPDLKRAGSELVNTDWLYTREGSHMPITGKEVQIILVGDIMPGRANFETGEAFSEVSQVLSAADLVMGNLEGVIVSPESQDACLRMSGPPPAYRILIPIEAAEGLQKAGFDLLGLANNHAWDCGQKGLSEMVGILERLGIRAAGIVQSIDHPYQPVTLTVNGLSIALIAFTAILPITDTTGDPGLTNGLKPAAWEPGRVLQAVRQARSQADFVIVSMHWGEEYILQADLWQKETALALVNAGADLVIGHHPHVIQETQVIPQPGEPGRNGFVAYSLGNFMFDQYERYKSQGLALRVLIDEHGLKAVQALPVKSSLQPVWMEQATSQELIRRVAPDPERKGFTCDQAACRPALVEPLKAQGAFSHGSIDLTGDGKAEDVWLHAGKITIYAENVLAWTSPVEWKVVDLALGDPNNDGRNEILAAVNGGRDGEVTSQPFILGYRGGIYRQLWGGSPVNAAILEVELGDVDSDGDQELVVIEATNTYRQTLAVWDWHGWGFSLFWRSPEDRYTELVVQEGAGGQQVISVGLAW